MKHFFLLFLFFFLILGVDFSYGQFRKRDSKQKKKSITANTLNYARPVEYFIGGLQVEGLDMLDENAMISLTGLKVGDKIRIPGEQISSAIRKLWKHGLVGNASIVIDKIEGDKIFLSIQLTERPRLTNFYFTGIGRARQASLREDISLIKGKIVDKTMVKNTEIAVKKFFSKKGFLNAHVNVIQELDTTNVGNVKLRIDIDLNSKIRIHEITFEGNASFPSWKLKSQLKKTKEYARILLHRTLLGLPITLLKNRKIKLDTTNKKSWKEVGEFMGRNFKPNIFVGSKLIYNEYEADKKNLIGFYNSKGYRDTAILSDTVTVHSDNAIDIAIQIEEGKKYYFRNITWTGNYAYNNRVLSSILAIEKGDTYNKELIEKKITFNPKGSDISGLYMDNGYLFFRVTPIEIAVEGDSIDIEMRIFEGEQATIREVRISGNERTYDHVIRRELSTLPGYKFSRSDIIRTQQRLSQMGFFNPQKIEPDIQPDPVNGTVDIEWKLQEQSNDQVQLSGGWGGVYGFVGTLGLTFNNFSLKDFFKFKKWKPLPMGNGQRLSLSLQSNGPSYQSYNFSFTEPWLGGKKPHSFTVSVNHSFSSLDRYRSRADLNSGRALRQTGVTLGLGRRLEWPDNYFSLTNSLSFLLYDYSGNYFNSSILPSKGRTMNIKFETTLSRNSVDSPIYPTRGSNISLNVSLTPPYSLFLNQDYLNDPVLRYQWVEMHKWMIDSKIYLKILGNTKPGGRQLVLAAKTHFGFIGSYNKAIEKGPFERFLLGGDGLAGGFNSFVLGQDIIGLRGYQNNAITPPSYATRGSAKTSNKIEGGIVYAKLVLELRYPIIFSQTATIYMLAFVEGGNNWDKIENFNPFNLYKSAGLGLKIFMPAFGLLGFNWAYGFDTLPGSTNPSGSQFHFTIGQQIR